MSSEIYSYCRNYEDPITGQTGLPLSVMRDGTAGIVLEVTAADLQRARKGKANYCVIARAVQRLPGVITCRVYRRCAWVHTYEPGRGHKIERFMHTEAVRRAIKVFDDTGKFPMGTYELRPPVRTECLDDQRRKWSEKDKTKPKNPKRIGRARGKKTVIASYSRLHYAEPT